MAGHQELNEEFKSFCKSVYILILTAKANKRTMQIRGILENSHSCLEVAMSYVFVLYPYHRAE